MAPESTEPREAFVEELRHALRHLYDPVALSNCPLCERLGLKRSRQPSMALQTLLSEAIEALRPSSEVPPKANAWRFYSLLSQRYLEQLSPQDVATNLAVSERQLRRLHGLACQVLAEHLQARYAVAAAPSAIETPDNDGTTEAREREMAWLRRSLSSERTNVATVIESAIAVVRPLIHSTGAHIECDPLGHTPELAVKVMTVHHALVSALSTAIRVASGGSVAIRLSEEGEQVILGIWAHRLREDVDTLGGDAVTLLVPQEVENLDVARDLISLTGGTLDWTSQPDGSARGLRIDISLPAAERVPVLIVDDNADALRLFERYLEDSRYRAISLRDPTLVMAKAIEQAPRVVVLDLMLPGIDGWELLGRLRETPETQDTPVIICTILPHEDLALALGAAALLRKPVSQGALLAALDAQVDLAP